MKSVTFFLSLFVFLGVSTAQAEELRVSLGGSDPWYDDHTKYFIEPFVEESEEATEYVIRTGLSPMSYIKAHEKSGQGKMELDAAEMYGADVIRGCDANLLLELDRSKYNVPDGKMLPCGVSHSEFPMGLVTTKDSEIDSLDDFFDPSIDENRTIRRDPMYSFEMALKAAGVPDDEIYDRLRTEEGVNLAFEMLDRIKDQIVWYKYSSGSTQQMMSGEASAAIMFTPLILRDDLPLEIHWKVGVVLAQYYMAVPKNSNNPELGRKFLQSMTITERNLAFNMAQYTGPTIYPDQIPERSFSSKMNSHHPSNRKYHFSISDDFWREHGDSLKERFGAWLTQ